jgi:hypothetical protein
MNILETLSTPERIRFEKEDCACHESNLEPIVYGFSHGIGHKWKMVLVETFEAWSPVQEVLFASRGGTEFFDALKKVPKIHLCVPWVVLSFR